MAKEFTVQYATEYWLEHGMDAKKIVLGLPLYGHSFHLDDASNHAVGAKATKPGDKGPMTEEAGMLGYNEYCKMLKSGQWTTQWSDQFSVPYAYKGNQWLSYDDKKSIDKKLDYLLQKKLGGAMVCTSWLTAFIFQRSSLFSFIFRSGQLIRMTLKESAV